MEEKERESYPSDLTDEQWEEIAPLYTGMRNCTWSKRELTDAVLYLVDSGCKWRQLPHDFPPYSTVHSFYRRARISGLWDKILEHLVKKTCNPPLRVVSYLMTMWAMSPTMKPLPKGFESK